MTNLVATGDIIYTPPIYICNIEKTFTDAEYRMYKEDTQDYFKNTLAGLRIKAEIACEQTDSVCTVTKFTEKTCILVAMLSSNIIGVLILVIEISRIFAECIKRKIAKRVKIGLPSGDLQNSI